MRSKKFLGGRPVLDEKEKGLWKVVKCPMCETAKLYRAEIDCVVCNNKGYIKQRVKEL